VQATLTSPTPRALLALHAAWALPPVALGLWFGAVDTLPLGEGRCASCGVEGYVVAAHVVAAVWLGGVIAYAAAARRRLREGVAAPGPVTLAGLVAVAIAVAACLAWHQLLDIPAVVAMLASLLVFPAMGIAWVALPLAWRRRPARDDAELARRVERELALAWVTLVVVLPGVFGWVWAARVDWLVF
jgi:hypothetical protein